ncbi:MAG: SRPBCC domain-containing protein [Cytophagaceae bacterium]|jgi:activator of HSP90 ATPase|nr:SRPBCC domain-containing protein [Cytophagaceae bacterium]
MELRNYKAGIKIKSEVDVVYAAITNPLSIELWSGYKAEMPQNAGGEFSMWDGDICGRILEYRQNECVVQEWYFGEQKEPSIATITVFTAGNNSRVEINHTNIPENAYDNIVEGWEDYYLKALKYFLEN